jgi:site-specific recombinase XerD
MEGISLYKIGEWLGHSDPQTTKRYTHLLPAGDDAINAGEE